MKNMKMILMCIIMYTAHWAKRLINDLAIHSFSLPEGDNLSLARNWVSLYTALHYHPHIF